MAVPKSKKVGKPCAIDFFSMSDFLNPSVEILRYECNNKIWHFYCYVIYCHSTNVRHLRFCDHYLDRFRADMQVWCQGHKLGNEMQSAGQDDDSRSGLHLVWDLFRPFLSHWSVPSIHLKAIRRAKFTKVCSWTLLNFMWIPWPEQMAWLRCPKDSFLIQLPT